MQVLDASSGPELPIVATGGVACAVVWPGMGATLRSIHRVSLRPAGRTLTLSHPHEAVYYVVDGEGDFRDPAGEERHPVEQGSMVHLDPGTDYMIEAGAAGLELVGGPAPPDPALYHALRA